MARRKKVTFSGHNKKVSFFKRSPESVKEIRLENLRKARAIRSKMSPEEKLSAKKEVEQRFVISGKFDDKGKLTERHVGFLERLGKKLTGFGHAVKLPERPKNVTSADKMFNKAELDEKLKRSLDTKTKVNIKDLEKAEKEGKRTADFHEKGQKPIELEPPVMTAEEMLNPEDELKKKEDEMASRKADEDSAAQEEEGEGAKGGDIFTTPDTTEEAVSHAINTLKDPTNIKHFTDLKDFEIKAISALRASNTKTQLPLIEAFCEEFENLRVSLDRKGRIEIKDVASAALGGGQNNQADSFIKRFFQK